MIAFANLLERLVFTPGRLAKIALLRRYFETEADPDRGLGLAAIAGDLAFAAAKPGMIRSLAAERTDPELLAWSYDYVGDLAETVALIWPAAATNAAPPALWEVVDTLATAPKADLPRLVAGWLDASDASVRLAILKLITGSLRVGASARLAKTALAEIAGEGIAPDGQSRRVAPDDIEEVWHGLTPPYLELFAWVEGRGEKPDPADSPVFRPPMLAHPLEPPDLAALDASAYRAEWKWDGIRAQLVATHGGRRLYSRGAEDISGGFPEIVAAMDFHAVLDGELLVVRHGEIAPFADLQQRLNRKMVGAKMLKDFPVQVRLYDLLFDGTEDLRPLPFDERRRRLEAWFDRVRPPLMDLSPQIAFTDLAASGRGARRRPCGLDRGPDAQARRQPLRARAAEGPVVEVEARPAHHRRGDDVRPARPRQTQLLLQRLHLRPVARRRGGAGAGAGGQGLLGLHGRGAWDARPLDPQPHHGAVRAGARGGEDLRAGDRLRRGAALDAAQVGGGAALPPRGPAAAGQAGGGGGPVGDADAAGGERGEQASAGLCPGPAGAGGPRPRLVRDGYRERSVAIQGRRLGRSYRALDRHGAKRHLAMTNASLLEW